MNESASTDLCLPSPPVWLVNLAICSNVLWCACLLFVGAYAPHSFLAALSLGLWALFNTGLIVESRSVGKSSAHYQDHHKENEQQYGDD